MLLPTLAEVRALHERYAPSPEALDLVFTHCEIVCGIAEQLVARTDLPLDADLVRVGALLHDIGVYRLYDDDGRIDHRDYVRHGVLGHEILHAEGFPERLRRFCSCHTGVGLTRQDIREQGLGIPEADYLAETVEEQLVMYADKFHSKTTPPHSSPPTPTRRVWGGSARTRSARSAFCVPGSANPTWRRPGSDTATR